MTPEMPQDAHSVDSDGFTSGDAPDSHSLSTGVAGEDLPLAGRADLEQALAEARAALEEYGRHKADCYAKGCNHFYGHDCPCSCGLAAALARGGGA